MASLSIPSFPRLRGPAVLAGVLLAVGLVGSASPARAQSAAAASTGVFDGFGGNWTGSGTIQRSTGETERLRCTASYKVSNGGNGLEQLLQCSSDNYNFNLKTQVAYDGGSVTGTWLETTRNTEGKIIGKGQPGEIKAAAQSPQFSASIYLQTKGNRQTVSIRSPGTELTNVSITLAKKG